MADREDVITRAFIGALASYQKDHGQKCTYDVGKIPEPASTAAAADTLPDQLNRGANNRAEQQQNDVKAVSAADPRPLPLLNNAQAAACLTLHQHEQQRNTVDKQQQQQQPSRRVTCLSNRNPHKEPVSQQQHQGDCAMTAANQNSAWHEEGMTNWPYGQWQGHQQPPWEQADNTYGVWDSAGAAATATSPTGWGWQGCSYQQYMPPPPPPALPLPPACFIHPAQQQPQACCMCGQTLITGAQPATTAATTDPAAVLEGLQQQVPADIAAVPESLRAARAAMEKATAVAGMQGSVNNMPELLMAWFYAGYHAGRLNSGH